jgi:hypothetical protein
VRVQSEEGGSEGERETRERERGRRPVESSPARFS